MQSQKKGSGSISQNNEKQSKVLFPWVEKGELPGLYALRGICALMVVIGHWGFLKRVIFPFKVAGDALLAVRLFFVISGFLITFLLLREEAATGTINYKSFYIRRIKRLCPALFFYLFLVPILQLNKGDLNASLGWWYAATYTTAFFGNLTPTGWSWMHTWSLSIEEIFYIFWPLAFFLSLKARKRIALFLCIAMPFLRALFHLIKKQYGIPVIPGSVYTENLDLLCYGCLFAFFVFHSTEKIFEKNLSFLRHAWIAGLVLCLSIIGIDETLLFAPFTVPFRNSVEAIGLLLILTSFVFSQQTWLAKFASFPPLVYLGQISYSLYLWQQVFLPQPVLTEGTLPFWRVAPLNFLGIFAMAIFSYHFIEKPIRNFYSKRTQL